MCMLSKIIVQIPMMQLTLTFLKIITAIIPINKTLQHENMFICKRCEKLINNYKI